MPEENVALAWNIIDSVFELMSRRRRASVQLENAPAQKFCVKMITDEIEQEAGKSDKYRTHSRLLYSRSEKLEEIPQVMKG